MKISSLSIFLASALFVAGCQQPETADTSTATSTAAAESQSVVVYSGRNEKLIQPILDRFSKATGIKVQVRYGETAEMAATILEEGPRTPADVFIAQDAAALGALSKAGLFRPLPAELLQKVPAQYAGRNREWIGLSGRARVIVYNPEKITPADLPSDLEAVTSPRYKGRFGVAPTNASLQAQIAVYHALKGADATQKLLAGMVANEPRRYARNGAIVDAVIAGEVDWGLVNHYYLHQALAERPDAPARNHFMTGGGAAAFVNVAGAGIMKENPAAVQLIEYLLGEEAQRYFATETFEYPLVQGIDAAAGITPLSDLQQPDIDWSAVSDSLEPALELIRQSGLLQE